MSCEPEKALPVVLTIAGSDSGGGAGIQTDLRTFRAFQTFGTSAITAVTSQNPAEVRRVDPIPPDGVKCQIETVFDKLAVSAVKTGMLFSREIICAVSDTLSRCFSGPVVVDPVMVSTSGAALLKEDAVDTVRTKLLPVASWVTPNIPEASLLAGEKLDTQEKIMNAARWIANRWHISVILKGGHASPDEPASDLVCFESGKMISLVSPRLPVKPHADHGTGCTFSSAFAALLAKGADHVTALRTAKAFVYASLRDAVSIGKPEYAVYGMYPADSLESALELITVKEL